MAFLSACQSGGAASTEVAKPAHKPETVATHKPVSLLPEPEIDYGPTLEYGPFREAYGPFPGYEPFRTYAPPTPFTPRVENAPEPKPAPPPSPAAKPKAAVEHKVAESAYTATDVQRTREEMLEIFRKLDFTPLLTTETPSLQQWASEGGGCAVAFTRDEKFSVGSVLSKEVAFPVTEAVPVDCANLQYAYGAAVKDGSLRNVEQIRDGKPAAMRYVSDKRDAMKRSLVKMVLAKPGQALETMKLDPSSS